MVLKTEPDCLSAVPLQAKQPLDVGQGLFGSPTAYRAQCKELSESFSPSPSPDRKIAGARPSPPTKRFNQVTAQDFSMKALISPVIVGGNVTCTSSIISHDAPNIAIEDLEIQPSNDAHKQIAMHPQLVLLGEKSSSCHSSYVQFNVWPVDCRASFERSIHASAERHNESVSCSPGFSLKPMALGGEVPATEYYSGNMEHVNDTTSQSSKRSVGKKKERRTRKSRSSSNTGTKVKCRREVTQESNSKQLDDIDVQQVEGPRLSITSPMGTESMNMFNQRFEVPTEHDTKENSPRDQLIIVSQQLNHLCQDQLNSATRIRYPEDELAQDLLAPAIITQTRDERKNRPAEAECLSAGLLNIKLCETQIETDTQPDQDGSAADAGSLYNAQMLKQQQEPVYYEEETEEQPEEPQMSTAKKCSPSPQRSQSSPSRFPVLDNGTFERLMDSQKKNMRRLAIE